MNNNETLTADLMPQSMTAIQAQELALIDKQIATAKSFPRNLLRVKENISAIASMDMETAMQCGYSLPRAGKPITGPSVHLARIVVQQYGNIRLESRVVDIDETHITAQSTCIDLENNVGIRIEVKRKITDRGGKRYNDDMITMTGNAACAIALRNAVYNTVPKPVIDAGYNASREKITGDLSDETKFMAAKKKTFDAFQKDYAVSEKEILEYLRLKESTQIKPEQLKHLIEIYTAIKDGDATADETFRPSQKSKEADRIEQQIKDAKSIEDLNALRPHIKPDQQELFNQKEIELKK